MVAGKLHFYYCSTGKWAFKTFESPDWIASRIFYRLFGENYVFPIVDIDYVYLNICYMM